MTTKANAAVKEFIKNEANVPIKERNPAHLFTLANESPAKGFKKVYRFAVVFMLAFCFNNQASMAKAESLKLGAVDLTPANDTLRDFYRNYVSAGNSRDFNTITEMINDNVIINGVSMKRDAVLASLKGFVEAVPNLTWYIEDLIIEGDHIAAKFRVTGTPETATFLGQNPKGNSIEFTEFASYKVRNGRFVEMSFLIDMPTIIKQLNK